MADPASDASGQQKQFAQLLLDWFAKAMRPLPWREGYDPYSVWISEIMLQQTQMERGVRYFLEWMRHFPTISAVAEAGEDAVLAAWEGLGYYSRARNLHAAAQMIMSEHNGIFPSTLEEIRALPGVGRYTAAAIASIAFNVAVPAVDANVLRIFSRILDIDKPVSGQAVFTLVENRARNDMQTCSPRLFNQALMELGALICGKSPKCGNCPVAKFCQALDRGTVGERPVKKPKAIRVTREAIAAIILDDLDQKVFIRKRPDSGLWAGLWEFPGGEIAKNSNPEKALPALVKAETGMTVSLGEKVGVVKHGYTTNHVTVHGQLCRPKGRKRTASEREKWVRVEDLKSYSFAAGHRKLLEKLGWK